jgi:hypothetical protein
MSSNLRFTFRVFPLLSGQFFFICLIYSLNVYSRRAKRGSICVVTQWLVTLIWSIWFAHGSFSFMRIWSLFDDASDSFRLLLLKLRQLFFGVFIFAHLRSHCLRIFGFVHLFQEFLIFFVYLLNLRISSSRFAFFDQLRNDFLFFWLWSWSLSLVQNFFLIW